MAELTLRGKTFAALDAPSEWQIMKLSEGYYSPRVMGQYAAMLRFVRYVLGDAWADFEEHVDGLPSHTGITADVDNAIGDYLASVSGRPTRTSSDSPGSEPSTSDTSRVASISPGSPRRASLSKGWIEPEPADGASSDAAAG
jgi:hypothetical protein